MRRPSRLTRPWRAPVRQRVRRKPTGAGAARASASSSRTERLGAISVFVLVFGSAFSGLWLGTAASPGAASEPDRTAAGAARTSGERGAALQVRAERFGGGGAELERQAREQGEADGADAREIGDDPALVRKGEPGAASGVDAAAEAETEAAAKAAAKPATRSRADAQGDVGAGAVARADADAAIEVKVEAPVEAEVQAGVDAAVRVGDEASSGARRAGVGAGASSGLSIGRLIYGKRDKTPVCFSEAFLTELRDRTWVGVRPALTPVKLEDDALFDHPLVVMSGEGYFRLSSLEVARLGSYLRRGGFVLASSGCSSRAWSVSFERELRRAFADVELVRLDRSHPIFHSVYDIERSAYREGSDRLPTLKALELEGRAALVWSPDGLNDTAAVGGDCCCCGGNEVKAARRLNVNIVAYALTH